MENCYYIGVDVSKETLQLAYQIEKGVWVDTSIKNTLEAINDWLNQSSICSPFFILEYTGTYSERLVYCLGVREISYYQLTSTESRGFSQTLRSTTKTDKQDARNLYEYGIRMCPDANDLPNLELKEKKQLFRHLSSLKKTKQEYENRKHAFSYDPLASELVLQSIERTINTLDSEIEKFSKELFDETDANADIARVRELLQSIPGIGKESAEALIVATGGFQSFENAKQVAKLVGVCPSDKQSGTSVKKQGNIPKTALGQVRSCLYMAALSAKRYNKACKALFKRLRSAGKGFKVAMVAVMHKLVKQAFAIVKSNTYFNNDFEEKTA